MDKIKRIASFASALLLILLSLSVLTGCDTNEFFAEQYGKTVADSAGDTDSAKIAAKDFTVVDGEGNEVSLSDNFGKPIIVNFWATWCPPCRSELGYFDEAYKQYGGDAVFMMVDLTDGYRDTVDGVKAFVSENGYGFPVYFDTGYSASRAYGLFSMPMTLFIDANGNEYQRMLGAMNESTLNEYIKGLLEVN